MGQINHLWRLTNYEILYNGYFYIRNVAVLMLFVLSVHASFCEFLEDI